MSRSPLRELRVGLVVLLALSGLFALFVLSSVGPGFLGPKRTIDVVFRDGQGIRAGCPVRVAGIDAGRVLSVQLFETDEGLRVRLRLGIPTEIADHLKQDVRIAVSAGLTGQSSINILNSGRSKVALVPGQVVQGIESSMFDPIIEQIGLGPNERNHLQHSIAQIRETIDQVAPRLRDTLGSLSEAAAEIRATVTEVGPRVQTVAAEFENFAKSFDDERVHQTLAKVQSLATQADAILVDLRPVLTSVLQNVDGLTGEVHDLTTKNRPQMEALLAGLNKTRVQLDAVLANTQVITTQAASILTQNRADIERTMANVRDATGFGLKLVQKLYGNPFYLSPFYKPRPEDIKAQEMYDSANAFLLGAKEFHDALKSLQAMQGRAMTKQEQEAYNRLFARAWELSGNLSNMQSQFAQGLRDNTPVRR